MQPLIAIATLAIIGKFLFPARHPSSLSPAAVPHNEAATPVDDAPLLLSFPPPDVDVKQKQLFGDAKESSPSGDKWRNETTDAAAIQTSAAKDRQQAPPLSPQQPPSDAGVRVAVPDALRTFLAAPIAADAKSLTPTQLNTIVRQLVLEHISVSNRLALIALRSAYTSRRTNASELREKQTLEATLDKVGVRIFL